MENIKSNKMIVSGDRVIVTLFVGENCEKSFEGVVRATPIEVAYTYGGSSYNTWIIEDIAGNIRYLNNYIQIIKVKPEEKK